MEPSLLKNGDKMKKQSLYIPAITMALLMTAVSCGNELNNDAEDTSVYVMMNIPYAEFYTAEAADTPSLDAVTSATTKSCNGSLTYGTYHTSANEAEGDNQNKETILGVMFPVKVEDESVLSSFTKITADDEGYYYIIKNRDNSTTTAYTGVQNLYRSPSYSYYLLDGEPAYYKELTVSGETKAFSKIRGNVKQLDDLYVAETTGSHFADYVFDFYTASDCSTNITSLFTSPTATTLNADGTTSEATLNAVKAVCITTSDGKCYGLPMLSGIWRGFEVGFNLEDFDLTGKTITKFTFITDDGVYEASSSHNVLSSETTGSGHGAKTTYTWSENTEAISFTVSALQ